MGDKTLSYSAFLKRVKDTIKHYQMFAKGDKVLVAVSGGADSVSLLKALLGIQKTLGITVVAANLDHQLRGRESRADSKFVKNIAGDLGVPCVMGRVNVKKTGVKGTSIEEKAREKRYEFLFKTAKNNKCNVIATGHTMDDQAETVMMKVIHGSSTQGIAGIPPVREEKEIRIVRPLIRVSRNEIIGFLKKSDVTYVEDSSNFDMRFLRNRIRHEILPYLKKINPKIERTLVNLSDTVREDLDLINLIKNNGNVNKGMTEIDIKDILLQPGTIRKSIFKELFRNAGGNIKKLTYRHWMDMDNFLRISENKKSLDLPGKVRVMKTRGKIIFKKAVI